MTERGAAGNTDKKQLQKTCVKIICRRQEYGADAGFAAVTAKGNNETTIKETTKRKNKKKKQKETGGIRNEKKSSILDADWCDGT